MPIRTIRALIFLSLGSIANYPAHADDSPPPKGLVESMQEASKTTNPNDIHAAVADMQYQSAMCTAFYTLAYQGAVQAGIKDTDLAPMKAANDQSTQITLALAKYLGMSEAALESQLKVNMSTLMDAMNHTWDNAPVIVDKYGIPCKTFMESPLVSWAHWLKIERENGERSRKGN